MAEMSENKNVGETDINKVKERAPSAKDERTRRRKGHNGAFFLGLAVVAFAVFGMITAVSLGVQKINSIADNSAKTAEYEKYLEPFVVIDPAPFDDVSGADASVLLDAAISALIYNSDKLNTYDVYEGEVTGLLVPQEDVEGYFVMMFGTEVVPVHADVTDSFYGVMYNSEKKSYIIPITSVNPVYTPKVYSAEKKGSSIILTVGYIAGTEWAQLAHGQYTAPEPSRFMKITLREDDNGYHIGSLQSTEAVEVADPGKTVPPPESQTARVADNSDRSTVNDSDGDESESESGSDSDVTAQEDGSAESGTQQADG
jgi:hypothetical protein